MALTDNKTIRRLAKLPAGIFGSTVAIAGLANGFEMGHSLFDIPAGLATCVTIICWFIFLALIGSYALKLYLFPVEVAKELADPVVVHYAGTFFISTVLIADLTIGFSLGVGRAVWLIGAAGGLLFMARLTSRLFNGHVTDTGAVPAILIPGLTALNSGTTGSAMRFGSEGYQADMFLFSIGIVYTLTFFVLIVYRLAHFSPLSNFFRPSLLLMCAPFEIGFQTYISLTQRVDLFATVIFYFGLFMFVVLFFHVFTRSLRFETSWWGACFSTGALTNAALHYAMLSPDLPKKVLAAMMLLLLTGLILATGYNSLRYLLFPSPAPPSPHPTNPPKTDAPLTEPDQGHLA